jgi:hypothetical protein
VIYARTIFYTDTNTQEKKEQGHTVALLTESWAMLPLVTNGNQKRWDDETTRGPCLFLDME